MARDNKSDAEAEADETIDVFDTVVRERDELRAENESLQALARSREVAIGERVTERDEAEARANQWCETANRQVAEIRRLWEALRIIAAGPPENLRVERHADWAQGVARTFLPFDRLKMETDRG